MIGLRDPEPFALRVAAVAVWLLVILGMVRVASALDREALCVSPPAGATCIGSEPLQETQALGSVTANPPSSVTTPMGSAPLDLVNRTTNWEYVTQTSKPSTAIDPLRALRGTGNVGVSKLGWYPSSITLPASGSMCARHMNVWSADSVVNEAGERKKIQDLYDPYIGGVNTNLQLQFQTQWTKSTAGGPPPTEAGVLFMDHMNFNSPWNFCSAPAATGDSIAMSDCKGANRCESQICIHGDFSTGDDIWWEFLMRVVDSTGAVSKTASKKSTPCDVGAAVTMENSGSNESNIVINFYNGQNCFGTGADCAECGCLADDIGTSTNYSAIGYREVNFALMMTSTDTSFTIPLPVEIVGTGISTPQRVVGSGFSGGTLR